MMDELASEIGKLLTDRSATVATAESCTGGMIAQRITSIAGSSRYFLGGYITYSNDAKIQDLRVPCTLLEQDGAVSESVAVAMAEGALHRLGSDYAISVTCIAGPDGGSVDKPVGTVWIALADSQANTIARLYNFHGSRHEVRCQTADQALIMLRDRMLVDT